MSQPHEVQNSRAGTGASPSATGTAGAASRSGGNPGNPGNPGTSKPQRPQATAGPFTLRDLVVGGSVLVMLIGSLVPYFGGRFNSQNMWNTLPLFFLGIGILFPLAVVGLFAGRRLSPTSRIRIGSLSLDQFGSVVAVIAVAFFFLQTASAFSAAYLVGLIGSLGLLAATTLARFIPPFVADFAGRKDVPAHVTARESVAATPKPAKPVAPAPQVAPAAQAGAQNSQERQPAAGQPGHSGEATPAPAETAGVGEAPAQDVGAGAVENGKGYTEASDVQVEKGKIHDVDASTNAASTDDKDSTSEKASAAEKPAEPVGVPEPVAEPEVAATSVHPVVKDEPISATRDNDEDEEPAIDAFWFAVGSSRPVIDESTGKEVFTFEPGDWELCLEDRGHEFVVQNKHSGQTGIMKDLSDIQIPPAEDSDSSRD